jgi:hypothetical protein
MFRRTNPDAEAWRHVNPLALHQRRGLGRWPKSRLAIMPNRLHIQATRTYGRPASRSRALYALLVVAVIASGLLWRSGLLPLPPIASKYGGDVLLALMVFFWFGLLFPRSPTSAVAMLAIGFSSTVEFSQLYHAPWIDAWRSTLPGRLILGSTFNWFDIPDYALGVAIGAGVEIRFRKLGIDSVRTPA